MMTSCSVVYCIVVVSGTPADQQYSRGGSDEAAVDDDSSHRVICHPAAAILESTVEPVYSSWSITYTEGSSAYLHTCSPLEDYNFQAIITG